MPKSLLTISNNPPGGIEWNEAWEGEASIRFLEILKANFEYVGFKVYLQLKIIEKWPNSGSSIQRVFLYKLFLRR